ncbi:DUF1178 family protein [Bosea rubneri]|uniref:DUF1178 family protein n=1 Tax=Bosea rubneri TaxID=3075434 RepID=A0ABU3SDU4_9HYPH|nr:DUF1178 family protein [Bosea sp. ZW T0_25]MDU0342970.1 DUF1178 family protein [Bosea sp. ZW T0_25]
MIRYALICDNGHGFESWFASSSGFDEQARRGLVACPFCDSIKIERGVMAPAVARTDRGPRPAEQAEPAEAPAAAAPATPAPAPVALMGDKEVAFRAMLTALHEHVAKNAEHVGPRFAEEALKIHHGESEGRAIYGEATAEDAKMLNEEGVDFLPLPKLPGARN